jgi:signal transduction histidine kinase
MRRHLVWTGYGIVLAAALFALRQNWQYHYDTNLMAARQRIDESIRQVDNLIQASIGHLNLLRISADDNLNDIKEGRIAVSPLYSNARETAATDGYCTAAAPQAHVAPEVSLSGLGPLPQPGTRTAHEINMVLMLHPQFAATAQNIPNLAWAYYTSAQRFIVMYPFISCADFHFTDDLLDHEFFKLGTPEYDPLRQPFWTAAYMDEAGKGLMATIGAPVYDGSRFLGTVAIDLTLRVLSEYVRGMGEASGIAFIVNDQGQLLAHPSLIHPDDTTAHSVTEALPGLPDPMRRLLAAQESEFVDHQGRLVYTSRLSGAPWHYVYVSETAALAWRAILDSKIEIAGLLLLTLLIAALEYSRRVGITLKDKVVELKQTQTKLKSERDRASRAEQAAHQASLAKSVMLANASHDLRTPLNAIIGFSELVLSSPYGPVGNKKYEEYLRDIHSSGSLLLAIINDVLDLSKIEAGRFEMKERAIDIAELVDGAMKLVGTQAGRAGVTLWQDVAAGLPALWADGRALQQILLNLLSNGIKFNAAGGSVDLRARTDSDGRLRIEVSDTGQGISPADLSMLFTPFSRGASADTAKTQGTGLGLSIVKSLVELHGGTVGITSTLGAGTTVTLTFPVERLRPTKPEAAA